MPTAQDGRGHLRDSLGQCHPGLGRDEPGRWEVSWWGSCLLWLPSLPVLPLHILQLTRGIHFGKCHLYFFFGHVQVKVLLPVFTDVRA